MVKRLLLFLLKAVIGLVVAVIALVFGVIFWLMTDPGGAFVRDQILEAAAPSFPEGELAIEKVDINLLAGLALHGVEIRDTQDKALVRLGAFEVDYDLAPLLSGKLVVDSVVIDEPVIALAVDEAGEMDLVKIFGPPVEDEEPDDGPSAPFGGLGVDIELGEFAIRNGSISISDPAGDTTIPHLGFSLGASVVGSTVDVTDIDVDIDLDAPIDQHIEMDGGLSLRGGDLSLALDSIKLGDIGVAISGAVKRVETTPDLDLKLNMDPIDADTVAALAGEAVLREDAKLSVVVKGPLSDLAVDAELASVSEKGVLGLSVRANLDAVPMTWAVALEPDQFAVDALTEMVPPPFLLNGRYALSGSGTEFPAGIDATVSMEGVDQIFAGESVPHLSIRGELSDGQFRLDGIDMNHSAATVGLSGDIDLVKSVAELKIAASIPDASALNKYGAGEMKGVIHFGGALSAGWDPEVSADFDGELDLKAFEGPGIAIDKGGGPIFASVRGDAAEGSGSLVLSGLDASGTTVDQIALEFEGGQDAGGNVAVKAGLEIGLVAMPDGQFDMAGLSGELIADVPAVGPMAATADMNVQTFHIGDEKYAVDGGPVRFSMDGDTIAANIDLRREDAPFLAGAIHGDLGSGEWRVEGFKFAVLKDDGLNAQQNIKFKLSDGGAEDVHFEIANADGKGRLSVKGNASADAPDLQLKADQIDLGYIMEMVDQIVDLSAPPEGDPAEDEPSGDDVPGEQGATDAVAAKEPEGAPKSPKKESKSEEEVAAKEPENPLDGLAGKASMDLAIQGDGDTISAKGWVSIDDFVMPQQVDGLDTKIELDVGLTQAKITLRLGDEQRTIFWAGGEVPVKQAEGAVTLDCDGNIRFRSYVPGVTFKTLAKRLPAIGDVKGRMSMNFGVSGEACNPDVGLVAAVETPIGPNGERVRLDVTFDREGDDLRVVTLVEQENERIARIGVALATHLSDALNAMMKEGKDVDMADPRAWLDAFDVKVALLGVDIGRFARMSEAGHPIQGVLAGGINLTGTMDKPKLESGLVMINGRIGEADIDQFTTSMVEVDGGYGIEALMSFREEGRLDLKGFLPLDLKFDSDMDLGRPGLDIKFSGSGLPMAIGAGPSGLTDAKGTIGLQGGVTGTLEAPTPALRLKSEGAGFSFLPTALRYDPVEVDIRYAPDGVDIDELRIQTNQLWGAKKSSGYFSMMGRVDLGDEGPEQMNLEMTMDEFWLSSTRAASIATSGNVNVEGNFPELDVEGKIKLDDASISVGAEILKDTSSFEIDESIRVHRTKKKVVARVKEEEEDGPSVADHMSVDLKVDLNSAFRLKADIPMSEDFGAQFAQLAALSMDLGLDGNLHIQQNKAVLSVLGELATLRGEAVAMGKRFAISEGTVTFTGENYANPQLNLLATHQVGQYGAVEIKIGGDVENTAMELSSPEYPDQTDVMSMLLFGKPTSAMSETEGESGAGLLSAAMASVGGQAARSTGAAFLQNVQVDPGSGSVKVGFPITDKIYLSIEKMRPETDTDNMTQAAVEWLLSTRAYGEVVTGDKGKSSGDVFLRWRF